LTDLGHVDLTNSISRNTDFYSPNLTNINYRIAQSLELNQIYTLDLRAKHA